MQRGNDGSAPRVLGSDAEALTLMADLDAAEAADLRARIEMRSPWPGVLDDARLTPEFRRAVELMGAGKEFYPAPEEVFAAFELTPFDAVKVVILGQDPYPNEGQATGLAFSIPGGQRLSTSLRNIHEAMRAEAIKPPGHGDLSGWAAQGVLLLNVALTVPPRSAGAHLSIWRPVTDAVLRLVEERTDAVFVLWGAKAQSVLSRGVITDDDARVVKAPHPAARGRHQMTFREARTFRRVNELLQELGQGTINWADL